MDYPSTRAERDRWVLALRGPRASHDRRRHGGWLRETEAGPDRAPLDSLTVFLTNRECPWRCVYCDLWQHTLAESVERGDIPHQVATAVAEAGAFPQQLKLYNAGSYFDPRAIPEADDCSVAQLAARARRVVVESHPRLVGDRTWRFRDLLSKAGGTVLEVAMGLETAHEEVLNRLNKGVSLDDFARVAATLRREGVPFRAFVLIQPPFEDPAGATAWAARSAAFAFAQGAERVSLIPVRGGNGALERLQEAGDWKPPGWRTVEEALDLALGLGTGWVEVDAWDLGRVNGCRACADARRARLKEISRTQRRLPPVGCRECERLPDGP